VELKSNGEHQLLVYVDDVNLLGDNTDTIKKNTRAPIYFSMKVGLEINIEKTKYMLLSHHQNAGQNRDIKITNRLYENVSQLKYLGTTITKIRLNSGNACYHSNQNLLSTRLLYLKIRIYKTNFAYGPVWM
jgi:hypothetical protein